MKSATEMSPSAFAAVFVVVSAPPHPKAGRARASIAAMPAARESPSRFIAVSSLVSFKRAATMDARGERVKAF